MMKLAHASGNVALAGIADLLDDPEPPPTVDTTSLPDDILIRARAGDGWRILAGSGICDVRTGSLCFTATRILSR